MNSHQISDESIAMTVQHSHRVKEHGQQIEQLGITLMHNQQADLEECQAIQAIGQQMQQHGQVALEWVIVAQQNPQASTHAFVQAGMEHAAAIKLHVEANRILLRLNQAILLDDLTTARPN